VGKGGEWKALREIRKRQKKLGKTMEGTNVFTKKFGQGYWVYSTGGKNDEWCGNKNKEFLGGIGDHHGGSRGCVRFWVLCGSKRLSGMESWVVGIVLTGKAQEIFARQKKC